MIKEKNRALCILFLFALYSGCNNNYIPSKDILNNHLISKLGYETRFMEGINKIEETHLSPDSNEINEFLRVFPIQFDIATHYTYKYNKDGTNRCIYLNDNQEDMINYEYGRKKELFSIAGYYPKYVKEIFEYHKDGYLKYIFRENSDNVLFKYTKDYGTVSCYDFRPIKDGAKRALKTGKFLGHLHIKKYEDGHFIISATNAKEGKEIEKYTYKGFQLLEKEEIGKLLVKYKYNDFDNIIEIICTTPDKKSLTYKFKYNNDDFDNWIDRQVFLNEKMILRTERKIKYNK